MALAVEEYITDLPARRVVPALSPDAVRGLLAECDFASPWAPERAVDLAVRGLWAHQTHTAHPRCFGLFVPAPATMGIAADALVAAFHPQLANWAHSPFGVEVEAHLFRALARRTGFASEAPGGGAEARLAAVDGTFTSGGQEANHTAVVTALTARFPSFTRDGVAGLQGRPAVYVTEEAHHSIAKAVRLSGLGDDALRVVPVEADLRMDAGALDELLARDRRAGWMPFMVVATAGSTNAGVIDPLTAIADVAAREGLWLHVDAAWGGAAALVPELRPLFAGLERADSMTLDAHKWLAVPMGAGLYLTRHPGLLERTFGVATGYMPHEADALEVSDPYARSMQWRGASRDSSCF